MATMIADVPGALASLAIQWWKHSTTKAWLTLIFRLVLSGLVTFLIMGGATMVTMLGTHFSPGSSFVGGIGDGMIWAGFTIIYVFQTDKSGITKGVIIAIPVEAAKQDPSTAFETLKQGDAPLVKK
jgi:hypothetical protein